MVLVILVIVAGFLRETLFVRIEWYEMVRAEGAIPPEHSWLFGFLENLSYTQLKICRYAFTLFFILVFYALCLMMVKWFFPALSKRIVHFVFIGVFSAAVLVFSLGFITGQQAGFYSLARYMAGVIETPLVVILLVPILGAAKKLDQ